MCLRAVSLLPSCGHITVPNFANKLDHTVSHKKGTCMLHSFVRVKKYIHMKIKYIFFPYTAALMKWEDCRCIVFNFWDAAIFMHTYVCMFHSLRNLGSFFFLHDVFFFLLLVCFSKVLFLTWSSLPRLLKKQD